MEEKSRILSALDVISDEYTQRVISVLNQHHLLLNLPSYYLVDITETIQNVKIKQGISKPILTIEQAKHLILSTKENRKHIWQYRDHAMVYLMITTGLRSVETRRAKRKDIKIIKDQTILYIQGKGRQSKDAYVKLPKGVIDAINDYLSKRKDKNPYLFISHSKHTDIPYLSRTFFMRMFRRVLEESGLEHTKITPHSLRHMAATINLMRGASLDQTKALMRHSNLQTTMRYLNHIKNEDEPTAHKLESYLMK